MLIRNLYSKKLNFVILGRSIGIESNEVIEVEDKIGEILLKSPWIKKYIAKSYSEIPETSEKKIPETPKVFETTKKQELKIKRSKKRK